MTDIEKQQIRDEEYFRHEVRTEIEANKKGKNKRLEFFNTPLGLFLLSTVPIGFTSFLYTTCSSKLETDRRNSEVADKLTIELDHRLYIISNLDSTRNESERDLIYGAYFGTTTTIFTTTTGSAAHTFDEFKQRSIVSLLEQLQQVLQDEKKKEIVRKLISKSTVLPHYFDRMVEIRQNLSKSTDTTYHNRMPGSKYYLLDSRDKQAFEKNMLPLINEWSEVFIGVSRDRNDESKI